MTKRTCSIEGCDRPYFSNGYCAMHYQRWRRHGDAEIVQHVYRRLPASATTEERFLFHVDKNGPIAKNRPDLGRCWVWTARKAKGYGMFRDEEGRTVGAHRWAFIHFCGPLPSDRPYLDHFACDNRSCCNPFHVQPSTHGDNTARGTAARPGNGSKTSCVNGHPFNDENTHRLVLPNGRVHRSCRVCGRLRAAQRRAKRRQE